MIAELVKGELVRLGLALAADRGRTLSTISTYAAGDGKFLPKLQAGDVGCTPRRADRVIQWFSDNWPEDLEWAGQMPRPKPTRRKKSEPEDAG